jgi:hypothetical protein
MAIRERQLNSVTFSEGGTVLVDLPRDACFHLLQISCMAGTISSVFAGTPTGAILTNGFPFNLMRNLRLIRNGSDVVWQGSGEQLAKEHYYLNNRHPQARLYTSTAAGAETLLLGTSRGSVVPAISDGIGSNVSEFLTSTTGTGTQTTYFDLQVEMWLQMGNTGDAALNTLVDARKLATYQLEITWANESAIVIPGTDNTDNVFAGTFNILSIDQDNIPVDVDFGTFKRSAQQYSSFQYGSNNNQVNLPRGNFYHGIILSSKAYKAGSTVIPRPENNVIGTIDNRINSNFSLRKSDFRQYQAKNVSNNGGRASVYALGQGQPQGWAMIEYTSAAETAGEMVNTYTFDQFDLGVNINAITACNNGSTTAASLPTMELLIEEVIPGVSASRAAPQGAFAGSMAKSSAKIGVK